MNDLKDEAEKRKWEEAIGSNLKECRKTVKTLYVCPQHFRPDDIDTQPTTILRDGKEETVPRKRPRLKRNVVPFICNVSCVELKYFSFLFGKYCNKTVFSEVLIVTVEIFLQVSIENVAHKVSPTRWSKSVTVNTVATNEIEVSNRDMLLRQEIINLKPEELPRHWTCVRVAVGVLFMFIGDTLHYATRSVLIKWDMSIEVIPFFLVSEFFLVNM